MKIVVTGSSGFIGTATREAFASVHPDWDVVGVDRVPPKEEFGEVVERVDLLRRRNLEEIVRWHKPDVILHIAAQARVDPSVVDPLATYDLNVQATLNVMHAAKALNVGQLVLLSSEAVYGRARVYPSPEGNDFSPENPYSASKVSVDVLGQQFDRVVPTCVVRSGMGWGPRSSPNEQVVARFIVRCLEGKPLKFPVGDVAHPTRDLNYVGDFCAGLVKIVEKKARGVYNLSGGREYTVLEIAEHVVKAVGQGEIEYDPNWEYRSGELGFRTLLDISKARRELGHEPTHHLDDGKTLPEVVEWYRENWPSYWG